LLAKRFGVCCDFGHDEKGPYAAERKQ
jgi:hypothetical protein